MAQNRLGWDNKRMQKPFVAMATLLAVGVLLSGIGSAQQAQSATTQTPSSAKTQKPASSGASTAKSSAAPKTSTTAKPQGAPTTQKEKFSYALGMDLGNGLKKQSVDVDVDRMAQGLRDALAGAKMQMTDDEARAVLMETQNEMRKKQQEKIQAAADANKKEGDAFLAANKSKEGVVTTPSGLQYKVLTMGTGPKPAASDTVSCNYKGTLVDGKEFDSSAKHGGQPISFPVNGVIKGWTEALQLMPVGSKFQLFIPSSLAYGERGAGADIGPNATLVFEVELVSIQPPQGAKAPEGAAQKTPDAQPKPADAAQQKTAEPAQEKPPQK
jgi:FKBP-type peptidyl-prolyl cis-trans isomerase